jgi:hypothetical protein
MILRSCGGRIFNAGLLVRGRGLEFSLLYEPVTVPAMHEVAPSRVRVGALHHLLLLPGFRLFPADFPRLLKGCASCLFIA